MKIGLQFNSTKSFRQENTDFEGLRKSKMIKSNHNTCNTFHKMKGDKIECYYQFQIDKFKLLGRKTYLGVVMIENHSKPSGSAIFETTKNLGTMNKLPPLTVVSKTLQPSAPTT